MANFRKDVFGFKRVFYFLISMLLWGMTYQIHAVSLTYGITVCNEAEELRRLLKELNVHLDEEDKIIVQVDKSNTTEEVEKVIEQFQKKIPSAQFHVIEKSLDGNFAEFKNNLLTYARKENTEFIFLLDADEYGSEGLMKNLKWYISANPDFDGLRLARANYYVNLNEHPEFKNAISQDIDDMGRFRYMDEKTRILNLKNKDIKFDGKVHEEISGCSRVLMLPYDKGNCWEIIHIKTPKRQNIQNELYAKLSKC